VDGTVTVGIADIEVDTPGDITDTGTTTPDITDGTAVGAGLLAGTIRGFCRFPCRFLILTTGDMDMGRDMDTARVTGTVTEPESFWNGIDPFTTLPPSPRRRATLSLQCRT
jgi:hypothetical protein